MNLMNNAITSINQAIVKNLEKVNNPQPPNPDPRSSSEVSEEDSQGFNRSPYDNIPVSQGMFNMGLNPLGMLGMVQRNNKGIFNNNNNNMMTIMQNQGIFQNLANNNNNNNALTPINPNDFLQNITFSSENDEEKSGDMSSEERIFREQSHSEGQMSGVGEGGLRKGKGEEESQDLWISDVFNHKENEKQEELSEGEVMLP